jgi:hypothetical protein
MLDRFLEMIILEDTEKLFTGDSHPNIFDAVSANLNMEDPKEIERTLKHYFGQVLQIAPKTSRISFEAQRMLHLCENAFESIRKNQTNYNAPMRDINDEIVDLYMDSLSHFSSNIPEQVLHEHIKYLEDLI